MIELNCPFCKQKIEHYNLELRYDRTVKLEADCFHCHAKFILEDPYENITLSSNRYDALKVWNGEQKQ